MKRYITWLWGRLPLTRRMRTMVLWLFGPKFIVGVVGLVRDDTGRLLLLRHTYRPKMPWGLPGGGLRPGETLEGCLCREVMEEAGMKVEVTEFLSAAAHLDRRLVDVVFACRPAPGESLSTFKPNAEIAEAHFFGVAEFPEDISPGMRRLIDVALRQVEGDRAVLYQPDPGDIP